MLLEKCKRAGFEWLISHEKDSYQKEVSIHGADEDVWLGVGYLVAKGWAHYRGSFCFRLTAEGRAAASQHSPADRGGENG